MSRVSGLKSVEVIHTGSILLDKALGVGGFPKGFIVTLAGPPGSGKSTLALHAMAECQRQGGVVVYVDTERSFDAAYAKKLGVNLDTMMGLRPKDADEALRYIKEFVGTGEVSLVVVDSINALATAENEEEDLSEGQLKRKLSSALRELSGSARRTGTCVMFLSQSRRDGEATAGGNSLGYYAGVQLGISSVDSLKKGGDFRISVAISKNVVAQSPREVKLDILSGQGISLAGEVFDVAEEKGLITRTDSGLVCNGVFLGQDRETARDKIEEVLKGVSDLRDLLIGIFINPPLP